MAVWLTALLDEKPTEENGFKEEVRLDGFSSVKKNDKGEKKQAYVPDFLFFGEETTDLSTEYGDKKYKNVKVRGLFNILNDYKFTLEENTPLEQEVALNPEMLGQIFENLLAFYNPETASTARKATGSFYTPREIVDYMVEQSLLVDLQKHFPTLQDLSQAQIETLPKAELMRQLLELKILDPACGSGAIVDLYIPLLQRRANGFNFVFDTLGNVGHDVPAFAGL